MIPESAPLWLILLAFVAALGPLVFFHELGHYLVARWLGIPAETFSIGFGREIVGWTDKKGTRWKVGWLQLGGYVKFVGDMGPASEPAAADSVPPELRARAFQFRPVWQRFLVVLAGPAANFLLAILIFAAFFSLVGAPLTNVVGAVSPDSAAERAGIEPGDRIIAIADRSTSTFAEIFNTVAIRANEKVTVRVERGETARDVSVVLGSDTFKDSNGVEMKRGLLGISPSMSAFERVPPWKAVPMATSYTISLTRSIFDGLVRSSLWPFANKWRADQIAPSRGEGLRGAACRRQADPPAALISDSSTLQFRAGWRPPRVSVDAPRRPLASGRWNGRSVRTALLLALVSSRNHALAHWLWTGRQR